MPQAISRAPARHPHVGLGDVGDVELHERPEAQPERAVCDEGGAGERVAGAGLPHAGEHLGQTTNHERHAEDDRLGALGDQTGVDHRQQKCCDRKRAQAEGPRVGKGRRRRGCRLDAAALASAVEADARLDKGMGAGDSVSRRGL